MASRNGVIRYPPSKPMAIPAGPDRITVPLTLISPLVLSLRVLTLRTGSRMSSLTLVPEASAVLVEK